MLVSGYTRTQSIPSLGGRGTTSSVYHLSRVDKTTKWMRGGEKEGAAERDGRKAERLAEMSLAQYSTSRPTIGVG